MRLRLAVARHSLAMALRRLSNRIDPISPVQWALAYSVYPGQRIPTAEEAHKRAFEWYSRRSD